MDLTDKTAEKQQRKTRGRPFKKGVSGNSSGRPKGKQSFRTLFEEAIKEIKKEGTNSPYTEKDIVKVYIQNAINGNAKSLNDLINRLYGKPKEVAVVDDDDPIDVIRIIVDRDTNKTIKEI
jgi:hypothetical protein